MDGQPTPQHPTFEDEDLDVDAGTVTFTPEEIAGIEEAIADFEENGGIPYEEVTAWLDSLETDNPLPEPQPRKFF